MTDQQVFDRTYITSIEVCSILQIQRPSLMIAIKKGRLPRPIYIDANGRHLLSLWDRAKLEPFISNWKVDIEARRG
jgi:predicted DNA-binding transcriptional regulator AlpA